MQDKFWDDETVKDFLIWRFDFPSSMSTQQQIEQFKNIKQHKKEYKILYYYNSMNNLHAPTPTCEADGCTLNSVLRLHDNESFCVKDDTNCGKIAYFKIVDGKVRVYFKAIGDWQFLNSIEKVKPKIPLFTTEDGVEIFVSDECYAVRKIDFYLSDTPFNATPLSKSLGMDKETNSWLYFSTKEAAEEYILLNKPVTFTLKEIYLIVTKLASTAHRMTSKDYINNRFEQIFKEKINQ